MERKRVGICLFTQIEVLDFCGPFEGVEATPLHEENRYDTPSPFEVVLIAEKSGPVVTTGGMKVVPDHTFARCPPLDILVVPGGWGTRKECHNPILLHWLRERATAVETLTAVCTGSMLLGAAGLLDGLHVTTHWRSLDRMRESFPAATVVYDKCFVEDGRLFTSAGTSAGIDRSLKVVARYFGEAIARATAKQMEYPYPEHDARRIRLLLL